MSTRKDIENREDIDKLVTRFYERMMTDDVIGFIFTDYAKIDLDEHLPNIADFWEAVLFQSPVYNRGAKAMSAHFDLHEKIALKKQHFTRWLYIFHQTIDELFEGTVAQKAKERSSSIAELMQKRIGNLAECGKEARSAANQTA